MPHQPYLLADHLTYLLPPDRLLFKEVQISLSPGDRVGLIGSNGVGKSTLLKLLARQMPPTTGTVQHYGSVYYLPQISQVQQQFNENSTFHCLSSQSDEWWNAVSLLEVEFQTVLDLNLPLTQLSGGELTKLLLAVGFSQNPDVLLLDEPTNHLDYLGLEALRRLIESFAGAVVVVSHKPFFLDQVTHATWELTPTGITVYGSNYSFYRAQKQTEQEARIRSHEVAQKELKRAKATAVQEQQRAAQSRRYGKSQAGSMPRIAAGAYQRKAEVTAGKLKQKHAAAVTSASQKFVETKVKTHRVTKIQLEDNQHQPKHLVDIQGSDLWVAGQRLIANIHLHLTAEDRVAIAGANGAGKSSLVKAIFSDTEARLEPPAQRSSAIKVVYLDQCYALVHRNLTVLQNMQQANSSLSYQQIRQQLGHFLFFNQAVEKPASVLSGGELARLALAMISIAAIDLLILDEPTNNLDTQTVDQMVNAIREYQGALLVISHDLDFLSRIQITQSFQIKAQTLQPMTCLPDQPKDHYQELFT
jgi:ATPase subunit of ABC transporter with duplicated ATPase domains